MKTFKNICAQGDVYIRRIDRLPANAVPMPSENGKVIVAHSETGHHHTMDDDDVVMHRLPDSIMDCFLVVKDEAVLEHQRPHDTHEPIKFGAGTYHVRRQREHTPEGWRQVAD
jgi:hypothetical protein